MNANQTSRRIHCCPNGCDGQLHARCLADSDDRIYSSWLQCMTCGWCSDQGDDPGEARGLTMREQKVMRRALRRSLRII